MQIYAVQGNQRAGKGICTVNLSLQLALLAYELNGEFPKIYANFHYLQYPYFQYFEEWKDIENVRNAIICYDEIGGTHDARLYNSKSQILFTNVFNQMGKMGNIFIYTCQREFQVEKRVREQTDFVIECEKNYNNNLMTQMWYNVERGRESPLLIGGAVVVLPELIYQEYNTFEVVASKAKFDSVINSFK